MFLPTRLTCANDSYGCKDDDTDTYRAVGCSSALVAERDDGVRFAWVIGLDAHMHAAWGGAGVELAARTREEGRREQEKRAGTYRVDGGSGAMFHLQREEKPHRACLTPIPITYQSSKAATPSLSRDTDYKREKRGNKPYFSEPNSADGVRGGTYAHNWFLSGSYDIDTIAASTSKSTALTGWVLPGAMTDSGKVEHSISPSAGRDVCGLRFPVLMGIDIDWKWH
ncbi:hypothetical protein B0H34DRAFT_671727 [Crassisporium funariophilum]|nr:hypothetical protein B0H34DRAFT_671727 [Crassisporium funariophilum]